MSWQTFGHERVKNVLDRQFHTGIFPHAYLFRGGEGLGKKTLALEFAKKVLAADNLDNHPDFHLLDAEGEITIELILGFLSRLSLKPFFAEKKVAIINNAQNLNPSSGNALLKTLEEASASTIIILVADSRGLLPTIVSRCQALNFGLFDHRELERFAESLNAKTTAEILRLSFGRTARLKRLVGDKVYLQEQRAAIARLQSLMSQRPGEKLLAITELGQSETPDLRDKLLLWTFWQAADLREHPGDYTKLRALAEAWSGLFLNKNKKLLLQTLVQKI